MTKAMTAMLDKAIKQGSVVAVVHEKRVVAEKLVAYEYQAGVALLEAAREKGLGPPAPRSKP